MSEHLKIDIFGTDDKLDMCRDDKLDGNQPSSFLLVQQCVLRLSVDEEYLGVQALEIGVNLGGFGNEVGKVGWFMGPPL